MSSCYSRPVFLEGSPVVSNLGEIHIGASAAEQHENDRVAEEGAIKAYEEGAIKAYNEGIRLAVELGDNGSRDLMESILADEEEHIDWLEAQFRITRTSEGCPSKRAGAWVLSPVVLAAVSRAARGIQTSATAVMRWSFQP